MKSFILKLIIFSSGIALVFLLLSWIFLHDKNDLFKLKDNVKSIFIGDSMLSYGVNDSLLENSYNYSRSAESPDWMYSKLKKLKEENPNIDTVFIAFDDVALLRSLHQTTGDIIYFKNLNALEAVDNFKTYIFAKGYPHSLLSSFHFESILSAIKNLKNNDGMFVPGDNGYVYSDRDRLKIDLNQNFSRELILRYSDAKPVNIKYYNKMIDFCRENDIKLFFIVAPIHKHLWEILQYDKIYRENFSDVPLIDCSHWEYPDSCWGDCLHLNHFGADMFTMDLKEYIRENL